MNTLKTLSICSGLAVALLLTSITAEAELIEKIVAILDGELILLSEVQEGLQNPVAQTLANFTAGSSLEKDALPYVIERKLLQREIQYLATPKEKELSKALALQYIQMTYGHSTLDELQQQLVEHGISEQELEKELLLYMKGVDYIRRKFRFNADIDDPAVVLNLLQKWLKDLKAKATIQMLDSDGISLQLQPQHPEGQLQYAGMFGRQNQMMIPQRALS